MIDLVNPVVTTTVGVVVGGTLASSSKYLRSRASEALADRRVKKVGDHAAIQSMFALSLDNHLDTQFKVGVAAAPSVSFSSPAKLEAERIDEWRRHLDQVAQLPRDYLNPDELIRYQDSSSHERLLIFTPHGLIDLLVPIECPPEADASVIDVEALVIAMAPAVVAISGGAHAHLYPGKLRTNRLDWRIQVSRQIYRPDPLYDDRVPTAWQAIRFPESNPRSSTPRQQAPMNQLGLAADQVRNLRADTDPSEIIAASVQSLIERAGYSGLDQCMMDIRKIIDREVDAARYTLRALGPAN